MKNKGFSLVELIVVIAIMAILVGVAVPVYSNYVEKAQMEADRQLVSEIKHAIEVANAADPFEGTVTIILHDQGFRVVPGINTAEEKRIEDILKTHISGDLKLKYGGWGNGVAATASMLSALSGIDGMTALLNNGVSGNLSFTEEIPELMEEIRNVAEAVAGRVEGEPSDITDETVIDLVQGAAAETNTLTVDQVTALWRNSITCVPASAGKELTYVYPSHEALKGLPSPSALTAAALVRAKNTCVALYLQNNWPTEICDKPANLYPVVSACTQTTVIGGAPSLIPFDVTSVAKDENYRTALLDALKIPDDKRVALTEKLGTMMTAYMNSTVSENDAKAYFAMMKTVNQMEEDAKAGVATLNDKNLDEYFEGASVPVKMFQNMISGNLNYNNLSNDLSGGANNYGDSNITITVVGDGEKVTFVIGPFGVVE